MRTYGQCCPIARASELLAERWSFIILRNIVLIGCRTFNEIADGAPGLSRGLLSKRLRDLEHAGVIQIRPKPDGPGSTYEPTQAGRELSEVMLALQRWGSQWAELTPEHAHPGVVLWGWVSCHLDRGRLPRRRVLVRFEYPTLSGPCLLYTSDAADERSSVDLGGRRISRQNQRRREPRRRGDGPESV